MPTIRFNSSICRWIICHTYINDSWFVEMTTQTDSYTYKSVLFLYIHQVIVFFYKWSLYQCVPLLRTFFYYTSEALQVQESIQKNFQIRKLLRWPVLLFFFLFFFFWNKVVYKPPVTWTQIFFGKYLQHLLDVMSSCRKMREKNEIQCKLLNIRTRAVSLFWYLASFFYP